MWNNFVCSLHLTFLKSANLPLVFILSADLDTNASRCVIVSPGLLPFSTSLNSSELRVRPLSLVKSKALSFVKKLSAVPANRYDRFLVLFKESFYKVVIESRLIWRTNLSSEERTQVPCRYSISSGFPPSGSISSETVLKHPRQLHIDNRVEKSKKNLTTFMW